MDSQNSTEDEAGQGLPSGLRATTIGTVVVRGGPIQMVIALLQSGDTIHIKVIEIEPKFTTLGENIDETIGLQRDHDELLKQMQGMPTPVEEFIRKADKLLASKRINSHVSDAMGQALNIIWEDILKLVHDRKHLIDLCANFHERMGSCRGKMASLEVACKDTMIPIEVDAVQDFLNKFKQLRIDVLSIIMSALKDGNALLASLQDIAQAGTLDTRPDHIKRDAVRAVSQVQQWLENLHDRRNALETAWQTRKTQLEQCLALAILAKDLDELENLLMNRKNETAGIFNLGECEHTANTSLQDYIGFKHDALLLRDRALKITRTTEKLVSGGNFAGDESCSRAYNVLSHCTEYLELVDQREHWLNQSKEFFSKAEKTLGVLEKLEIELSTVKVPQNTPENFAMYTKILKDMRAFTEEPLRLGYALLDDVGRTIPETQGIKRVLDEIENRKIYIEGMCSSSTEEQIRVTQALNSFLQLYNEILSWLVSVAEAFLKTNNVIGGNLEESKSFLHLHHQLMQDLEIKGETINSMLENIKQYLDSLDTQQRYDVDTKAESLHRNWIELKELVLKRVDLVSLYIDFLQKAQSLSNKFDDIEQNLKETPEEKKLQHLEAAWNDIKASYGNLKAAGMRFLNLKVADPYLETKSACSSVEEILNSFSNRQFDITSSWEKWTTSIVESKEIQIILEKIMNEQIEVLKKTTTLDAQLYPVFVSSSEEPKQLKNETESKLEIVFDDIEKAQSELLQRMNTATNVHAKDVELQEKVDQVASNLLSLKNKLDNIKYDYRSLVESLLNFLDNIISLRTYMDDYFLEKQQIINDTETTAATVTVVDVGKISRDLADHESFRENVMDKFRSLISQSEKLIDRVRVLEPPGAREHDTDRILKLLENLRIHFESNNDRKMTELQKSQLLTSFDRELNEIHNNLDSVTGQLDDIKEQKIETSAAAKTTSLAFEYFERTIELLEKRIENFIKSSENIYATNPDAEPYVTGETEKLKEKWDLLKGQVKNTRNSLNLTNDYYELYIQVESQLRELSSFHSHAVNKIPHLQNSVEANNVINDIEQCLNNHENPLNSKLHQLKSLSLKLYNDDKTSGLQNDLGTLIQSFTRLKSDVSQIVDRLRNEEKQKDLKDQVDHDVVKTETKTEVVTVFSEIKYTSPKFVKQLNDAEIVEGEKLTFECEVTGNPEPTIEWFKDGISIQNNLDYRTYFSNGLCSLSIEETFAADSAKFMCRASNLVGSDETFAILTIKEHASDEQLSPPKVLRYLKSGTAQEGSPFEFLCVVNGNPLPTVQWFKDDKCIDDSPDYIINYNNGEAILKFEKVYLEDRAIYTCKATNSVGFEQCSAKLSVEPLEPTEEPHFKVHLSNVMARVGQKIKLESVVAGIPTPELFWTHNGKPFNSRDAKYENERVTLIISEAFPKDAGIYVLTARNLAGEAYSSCNVTVKGRLPNETSDSEMASDIEPIKPSVQLPLKNISVFEGKSVRLDCVIIGQPEPEVIWYHNDRPVKESADVQLLFQGDRCSLVIQEAYLEDAGSYKVVAINSAGEAASSCALTVTPLNLAEPATRIQNDRAVSADGQPKFDKFLTDVLAAEGDTVDLECSVSGDTSNLSVKWFLSNKELFQSDRIQFITDNDGVFKLVIKNVSVNDKGVYTIKVSNPNGDAKCFSHLIVKSVNAPENQKTQMEIEERFICPSFKELFSDKNAHNEDLVKFECIVVGKPTPKIKWLFNDQPVHGKNFLISISGDRQVLTIPSVSVETVGKIACVAENEIGRATCVAHLSLIGDGSLPSTVDIQSMSQEHNAESSKVTIKKQTFTTTSMSQVSTIEGNIPHIELNGSAASFEHNFQQSGQQAPEIVESRHYQEFHKTNDAPSSIQQKSIILVTKPEELPRQKLTRKEAAPRFVSPLVGKIVDQGCNVTLEAIYDGFPSPEVKVLKNGDELFDSDRVKILNKVNKITIDVADVNVRDAGRYSITVSNNAGSSTSTADIVVKKSIFPPVFGRRLQAQMAKRGERIIMEVEITGTPDPTVMWYKNGKPLAEVQLSQHKIKSEGNTHRLIIEKAKVEDSGKFMVKATNSGGEAQSLADFAVLEPTPERMVEVVKTVVYDDLKDFASETKKPEIQSFHTSKTEHKTESDLHGTAETSIITEHRCTTEATMRLEHKPTYLDLPEMKNKTPIPSPNLEQKSVSTTTDIQKSKIGGTQIQAPVPLKIQTDSSSVESSSISKKSAFEFFKKIQVEPLSPADEKYMKYDEYSKTPTPTFSLQPSAPPPPPAGPKYGWAPVRPVPSASTSVPTFIPIQKEESASFTDPSLIALNLKPGTPPEIGYIPPKPETSTREHISDRIKKLEESQSHSFEAPSGGIQVLPQITKKQEYISRSFVKETKFDTSSGPIFRPQAVLPTPIAKDRSPSPLPSAEGVAMQKLWASPKPFEHQESYQSTQSFQTKTYSAPQQEVKPESYQNAQSFQTKTFCAPQEEVKLEPQPEEQKIQSIKETKKIFEQKIQQSSSTTSWTAPAVELKSPHLVKQFYTKPEPSKPVQEKLVDIHLEPGTPPEICFAPIPAEGERRQSLVEAMEKSLEKNLMNEPKKVLPCSVRTIPPIKKDTPPPLPPKDFHISAPPLPTRPVIVEKQFKPPPPAFPPKIVRTEYSESEYESDKWKYSESESDEPVYRSVKAPQGIPARPKSFEQPVLPPSQFETPLSEQKFKTKTSGYTADTEESFYRKFESKTVQESRQVFESKQTTKSSFPVSVPTPKVVPPAPRVAAPSQSQQKDFRSSSFTKNVSMTTKQMKVEEPQQFPFKPDTLKPKQQKVPPPPSPSKFIKSEFRDTEFNSDYEERIQPLWKPFDADAEVKGYRPVRPNFTPTERRSTNLSEEFISPAPTAEYYHTPRNDGPPSRPKFEPIKHEAPVKTQAQPHVYKPKPVSAKFIETSHTATPQKSYTTQYYTAVAGAPQHHASVATETRNTMQMKESSETCHRVVNMSQTKRVIHFDQHKINQQTALEPFPYSPSPATTASPRPHTGPTPTPTKFIPGEYRESDYESEVEGARIRPLWTPNPSDYDEPKYRRVNPPRPSRSVSLPRSYERVFSPMEFDTGPPEMPSKISVVSPSPQYNQYRSQTLDRYSRASSQKSTKDDMNLKVGSPPKFGYIQENAQNQFNNINTTFRKKTNQFINDVSNDVKSQQSFRPGFKRAPSEGDNKPQAYREESRLSQYGTKHVDPNTGLIYFKYDFGYEFGIIFPGEGKKFIGGVCNNKLTNTPTNSRYPLKHNDIVIPVQHERSTPKNFNQNGFTSESEFSETEYDAHAKKRYSLPITISVDDYHKNDRNFHNGVAAAEYPYNGVPVNAQNNREERPKRPPIFITPLKDIAVVIAQTARFECIVQCDPYPKIVWSKNGFPLHHSNKHLIEFRNGVCRLTIPEAYPDDAGTYSCAGTNELGTATTTADLIVPGNKCGTRY